MADFQEIVDRIKEKYQPLIDEIQRKGQELGERGEAESDATAMVDFKFTVEWVDQEISFDIPTIIMKTQEMSLDLPQITMKTKEISFDVPEAYMKDVVISDNPITGKMIISVPDIRMRTVKISFDIPEFTMGRTEFSMDIPEIHSERINWVVAIPQFTGKDFNVRVGELQEEGDVLKSEGESLASQMKQEVAQAFQDYYSSAQQNANQQVIGPFSNAVGEYDKAIKGLEAQGIDPIKVPTNTGERNLRKERDEIVQQYKQIAETLNAQQKDAA
ncbi:MAG: hypothetical protein RSB25_16245 [Acinetobacter sp.]